MPLLHIHITKASNLLLSVCVNVHVFAACWKTSGLLRGGMELEWFPVLVGPEVGSPTEVLHQLRTRFLLTDYGYLLQQYHQMMDQPPARFLFPVALLPVPAWWQTLCFQSEYPRGQRDCERRVIPVDLDWATTSGRAISLSGGSKGHRTPIRQWTW